MYECSNLGDVNLRSVAENERVMERVHTLTSILAGTVAGLFNCNLYSGVLAYIGFHLLILLMMAMKLTSLQSYFVKKTDPLFGIATGIMVFICAWIITFNIVYTL
jgi:hypothetical protein